MKTDFVGSFSSGPEVRFTHADYLMNDHRVSVDLKGRYSEERSSTVAWSLRVRKPQFYVIGFSQ